MMQTDNVVNPKNKKISLNWFLAVGVILLFIINNLIDSLVLPYIVGVICGYINFSIYFICIVAAIVSFIYLIKKFNLINFVPILLSLSPLIFTFIVAFLYTRAMSGF